MIFVECLIRGELEDVWSKTQDPALHERWDMRFSSIQYGAKDENGTQEFVYSTRIGLGLQVRGWGESVGEKLEDGKRTSALKFGSDEPISLIERGSGYWQYEEQGPLVRFQTGYDYQVRFGWLGRFFDTVVFRPLMAWATALSFDRLRLWVERGLDPESTLRSWLILRTSSFVLGFVWLYQGLVPKTFARSAELKPLLEAGISPPNSELILSSTMVVEVAMALGLLVMSKSAWPWVVTIVAMPVLGLFAVITDPQVAISLFNPVTLNILMAGIALVGLLIRKDAPSASNCRYSSRWSTK